MSKPASLKQNGAKFERREYSKDSYYLGYMVKFKKQGKGTMVYSKKSYYEGEWHQDSKHGQGSMVFENGDRYKNPSLYTGQWAEDKYHGYGEFISATHSYYKGDWRNGHKQGKADELTEDGERYIGDYCYIPTENGMQSCRHGKGKIIYEVGGCESYEGEWDTNKFHGSGMERYRSGNYFQGEFYKGKKEGKGGLYFKNLTYLTGEWSNGTLEGFATSTTGPDDILLHEIGNRNLREVQARGMYSETVRNGKFRVYFQDTKYLD